MSDAEAVFCSNGWLEVRVRGESEEWIATDSPRKVAQ